MLHLRLLHGKIWQWWIFWKLLHPVTWNLVIIVKWMSKWRIMSNQGQGLLSHFYKVLYVLCLPLAQISGEGLQDHWFDIPKQFNILMIINKLPKLFCISVNWWWAIQIFKRSETKSTQSLQWCSLDHWHHSYRKVPKVSDTIKLCC